MFLTIGVGGGTRMGYLWKLALLVGLLIVDAFVACVFDYDVGASSSAGSPLLLLLRCCNQFAVAAALYWHLKQTYPFHVGLVGLVTSRFHKLFLVSLLYFLLTIFACGLRVMNQKTDMDADLLSQPFLTMSSLSKLLAPFYYAMTVRAAYELCFPVYYDEEAWQKILERPMLQERSARMKKEANRGGGHRKNKYLHRGQEGDDSSSISSSGGE